MWLLNASTYDLNWFDNPSEAGVAYSILSHTWDSNEVTFQDMRASDRNAQKAIRSMTAFRKVQYACAQTLSDGLRYTWLDTCCIDKTSSAELTESINSMYQWYMKAVVCYAYLSDIDISSLPAPSPEPELEAVLKQSRWFTRGWTLQELLAPRIVVFLDKNWRPIGDKTALNSMLSTITGIDAIYLQDLFRIQYASVAKRMSWAAHRSTSRIEDRAYCLFGIFGVNLPLLYGEGATAFQRLQQEILRTTNDQSIFLWQNRTAPRREFATTLAVSPYDFAVAGSIVCYDMYQAPDHHLLKTGLQISLPVRHSPGPIKPPYAILNCRYEDDCSGPIVIGLESSGKSHFFRRPGTVRRFGVLPLESVGDLDRFEDLTIASGIRVAADASLQSFTVWLRCGASLQRDFELANVSPKAKWNQPTNTLLWREGELHREAGHFSWKCTHADMTITLLLMLRSPHNFEQPLCKLVRGGHEVDVDHSGREESLSENTESDNGWHEVPLGEDHTTKLALAHGTSYLFGVSVGVRWRMGAPVLVVDAFSQGMYP